MSAARNVDDALIAVAEVGNEKLHHNDKSSASSDVEPVKLKDGVEEEVTSIEAEFDAVHAGLEFPTEEEKETLRRVSDALPWSAYLIALVEMAERFSFYGTTIVFTNFIQWPLPEGSRTGAGGPDEEGQSGALGLGQQTSTGISTFYQFWCYITPLYGAYIADAHLGRYNTVCLAVVIAFVGHVILIVSAVPGVINNSAGSTAAFIIGLIIMGVGTGFFKANIAPLVAEQYRRTKLFIRVEKSGERVIVDPVFTVARLYMYFYFFINVGALIGQISMAYAEKYVGFWLSFTLPTIIFFLCPIVLFLARNRYIRTPPTGSVFATFLHLWTYAMKGRFSWNPVQMYRNMTADDFWHRTKPSELVKRGEALPRWMDFNDVWVDEVRRGVKACAVFAWYPIYWLPYNQILNNLTSQAATMTTHGVPNDVLGNLDPFALLILIPVFDFFLYPALKKIGINFTALKKITFGFVTGAMAMIWATVVQHYIYRTNPCGQFVSSCDSPSTLNVWTQTGSYVLLATSEILASITGLEYAFTKAPKNMRSLVLAVFYFTSAVAAAIGEAFVSLSLDPLLEWNYGVMACISGIGGMLFWMSVRKLDQAEEALNEIGPGNLHKVDPTKVNEELEKK